MTGATLTEIKYQSHGSAVNTLLVLPEHAGPCPGLVAAHGGVNGIDDNFRRKCRELASHGFAVIGPSFRGEDDSEGEMNIGRADVEDLIEAVDVLRSVAAITNVALWGNSRGGLTALLAAAQSNQFVATAATAAIVSLEVLYDIFASRDDPFLETVIKGAGGTPADVPQEYDRRSAVALAGSIRTPLLIMHAEDDTVVDVDGAKRLDAAIRASGQTQVELNLFPGGGHRFLLEGQHEREATDRLVSFLKLHTEAMTKSPSGG